jgi:hypothetical protein
VAGRGGSGGLAARAAGGADLAGQRLYAGFDADDLATAHRVLAQVTERAERLRTEL